MRRAVFMLAAAGCASQQKAPPPPQTLDEAEIAFRIALNAAHVAAVQRQEAMFLWALAIGGIVAMLGLALGLAALAFGMGKKFIYIGAVMVVFGVVVGSVAVSFPHYGEQIALGAAILVGLVLAFAGYIGVTVALEWRKALVQTVRGVEAAKEVIPLGVKESVFSEAGPISASMDDRTKRMVAGVRRKITTAKEKP